eukprot:CAMPEP_0204243990 /NCGR_PEP_ID=MMETSP0361-20130328/96737_1 /ASSEMBLY_ACC=CAM_ASM_000343 /TAXON_ID=268821 /ORGANISM="Scrippsiella Hangoei, Strain SHTV-5" /LENGTH=114 /DNA_ID=CAMNT_0051216937 /DNA_START=53 /DNA_END=394 /DNA_ORIENTATION=-
MALAFLTAPQGHGLTAPVGAPSVVAAKVPDAPAAGASSNAGLVSMGVVAAVGVAARQAMAGSRAKKMSSKREFVAMAAFENELGVQEPVGFWDPLNLSSGGDVTSFKRRRSVEL